MKTKHYILICMMLQGASYIQAAPALADLNAAATTLAAAQIALANLIGSRVIPSSNNSTNYAQQLASAGQVATCVTNNSASTTYLRILDQSGNLLTQKNIALNPGGFSYIPSFAASIQCVDGANVITIPVTKVALNTLYSITNSANAWKVTALPAPKIYTYKNSTNVPLVVCVTVANNTSMQELAPNATYSQVIDSTATIAVQAHADIPALFIDYDSSKSYSITMNQATGLLTMTPVTGTDGSITNTSGLPIIIDALAGDASHVYIALKHSEKYKPVASCTHITAIPAIADYLGTPTTAASYTIVINNGSLSLQS